MSKKLQITTHYSDGRPSETRDMTEEEEAAVLQLPKAEPKEQTNE
jgi:hypothetical protein